MVYDVFARRWSRGGVEGDGKQIVTISPGRVLHGFSHSNLHSINVS